MNAITILSYCDTDYKKNLLKNLINKIKSIHPERKILVYSHFPKVEFEYYENADYYIYDYSNPESPKFMYDWVYVDNLDKTLCRTTKDWGIAVIQMIRRSLNFLKSINVDSCIYLNYDIDIKELDKLDIIDASENSDKKGLFCKWGSDYTCFSLCYFWMDVKNIDYSFINSLSPENYLSYESKLIPEEIFRRMITDYYPNDYSTFTTDIGCLVSGTSREVEYESELSNFIKNIQFAKSNNSEDRILCTWNCTIDIESITIEIDGITSILKNKNNNKRYFQSPIYPYDIDTIYITEINDIPISKYHIKLGKSYWDSNWYLNGHHDHQN